MLKLTRNNQLIVAFILVLLMAVTRGHHFASLNHLPGASWAVFFLAGAYLSPLWVFPALFLEAALLDFAAISWSGVSSFCVSPAYIFLLPAYGSLWLAGRYYAKRYIFGWATLPSLSLILLTGALVCELLSSGGFYFFSGRFVNTSWAEFAGRVVQYFPPYLESLAFYVTLAAITHIAFRLTRKESAQTSHF